MTHGWKSKNHKNCVIPNKGGVVCVVTCQIHKLVPEKIKNIRNHIWILIAVISDVLKNKENNPIDIQILDAKQCFDGLWLRNV